jgi:hypothetical protein
MKRSLLAVLVSAAACSHQAPVTVPVPAPALSLPFSIATPEDTVRGYFKGTARQTGTWIDVTIDTATVDVPAGRPELWRGLTVSAFVAADFNRGDFRAPAEARPVNVFRFLDFSKSDYGAKRTVRIESPLHFLVPIPPGAALSAARLGIQMEWVFPYGGYGESDTRLAFTQPLVPPPVP